jgi:hypothetical protein
MARVIFAFLVLVTAPGCSSVSTAQAMSVCELYRADVAAYSQPVRARLAGCYSEYEVDGGVFQFLSSGCGLGPGCRVEVNGTEHVYERFVRLRVADHYEVGTRVEVVGDVAARPSPLYDGPVYAFVLSADS